MAATATYLPLVRVTVWPQQSAERPGIEKTSRTCVASRLAVPMFKASWGQRAAKIDVEALPDDGAESAYYEVQSIAGRPLVESEKLRLIASFGKGGAKIFAAAYGGDSFETAYEKYATDKNPWAKRRAKAAERAAEAQSQAAVKLMAQAAATISTPGAAPP